MKIAYLFISLLIFFACNKDSSNINSANNCKDAVEAIEYIEDANCFYFDEDFILLKSQNELDDLPKTCSWTTVGIDPIFDIDFETQNLIAYKVSASGCEQKYEPSFFICDDENTYTYKVTINEFGFCEPFIVKYVFAIIPKLNNSYELLFDSETIQNPL